MVMYDWDGQQALKYTAYMILISAVVSLVVYLLYAWTPLGRV